MKLWVFCGFDLHFLDDQYFLAVLQGSIGNFCIFLPERFIGSIDYFLNGALFTSLLIAIDFFSSYMHKHCVKYEDEILCAILQTVSSVK